jgi:hypothetical protein
VTGVYCDCNGPPWPEMTRLNVAHQNRFYLCRECGTVKVHVCRDDGTIITTEAHDLDGGGLPLVVVEQAQAALDVAHYEQLSLFDGDGGRR